MLCVAEFEDAENKVPVTVITGFLGAGKTTFLKGEQVDRVEFDEVNAREVADGRKPATASAVLLGGATVLMFLAKRPRQHAPAASPTIAPKRT